MACLPLADGRARSDADAKAAREVSQDDMKAACGPHQQYALGQSGGCEVMHKCISALTEANPRGVVLAFDCSNAYNNLPRQHILSGLRARAPALLRFARCWLGKGDHALVLGQQQFRLTQMRMRMST